MLSLVLQVLLLDFKKSRCHGQRLNAQQKAYNIYLQGNRPHRDELHTLEWPETEICMITGYARK